MARLAGSTAIVTGASRGIGAAIASSLAAEGATVAVLDVLAVEGAAVAARIGGVFVPVDLADPDSARAATALAVEKLGGVTILVNNAGIFAKKSLLDITAPEWDRMFAINARAVFLTMQTCAPTMIAAGGGRIVNIASMAAKHGGASEAHYAATKAAVVALTRSAAHEWGCHGIVANALCPGYVLTEMGMATRTSDEVARWSALSPLGRLATAQDVASAALFLTLPDSAYITGQAINVSGGMITH